MWNKINRDDVPGILYHYCSIDTFMKIIEHKTIRLLNIFKMNDSSEIMHVLELLPKTLYESQQENTNGYPLPYKGKKGTGIVDELISDIKKEIQKVKYLSYIACFSKHRDDIGQWRGYADDGSGVAIGYDGMMLYDEITKLCPSLRFINVNYNIKDHQNYIKNEVVPQIFKALRNAADNGNVKNGLCSYETMVLTEIIHVVSAILLSAIQYKHEGFEKEQEWRLCMDTFINQTWSEDCKKFADERKCGNLGKMSFTNKGGNVISSYFDLNFGCIASNMIKEIILGPRSMNEDDIDLEMFLHINGFNIRKADIRKSSVPYVRLSE